MRVEFSPRAFDDLESIGDHIAEGNPENASAFVNELIDRSLEIALAPEGYIERPELGFGVRSVAFHKYMIFYTAEKTFIRIERILHGSRDYTNSNFL